MTRRAVLVVLAALAAATVAWAGRLPALTAEYADTFQGHHYVQVAIHAPTVLYRRWGNCSHELGRYWSRTSFSTATKARDALALPKCNTATHVTVIRVPTGTTVYEGKAAPMFGEPGGGDQILFADGFYVPASWVRRVR